MDSKTAKGSILVVDDSPEQIEAVAHMLYQNGFKAQLARDGARALELLKRSKPDLILLDVYMPEMDGFEVCRRIKEDDGTSRIPIIFFTASNDEASIQKAFALGAQDYVTKPFKSVELLARVNAHIKIRRQAKELEKSYKELDSFCYTVAHDLKAPLLSIQKLSEYLVQDFYDKLGEEGNELVGHIQNKSSEIVLLVNRLLEFARFSDMSLKIEPIDLNELFHEVFEELMRLSPNRKIQFAVEKIPLVSADRIMIRQLIANVLSNAIKYTRKKENAVISVGSEYDGNMVTVFVRDNGAGFDMRYSEKLFKVFQRLHSQNEFEGTGAGLAIAQRIIQRHGGSVWMTGEMEKGATFYFRLDGVKK
jgi:two-component system, sensor histidine kinase and response regulator